MEAEVVEEEDGGDVADDSMEEDEGEMEAEEELIKLDEKEDDVVLTLSVGAVSVLETVELPVLCTSSLVDSTTLVVVPTPPVVIRAEEVTCAPRVVDTGTAVVEGDDVVDG
jgi:hypothetical protein